MEIEKYLALVAEMSDAETTLARRTEITLELTDDYKQVQDSVNTLTQEKSDNDKQIKDLTHSHSLLLRKTGILQTDSEQKVKTANHSETITLDMLEGGN